MQDVSRVEVHCGLVVLQTVLLERLHLFDAALDGFAAFVEFAFRFGFHGGRLATFIAVGLFTALLRRGMFQIE